MAELDPKTREHLHALCRQITVAHELDPEIQEELYGHMEDKLLAYLSGEERLTEQDAFVLVREHFGDAAVLKQLLQNAHPVETHVTYARRLLAAFVLFLTVDVFMKWMSAILGTAAAWYAFGRGGDWFALGSVYGRLMNPLNWATVIVASLVLVYWNRRIREGRRIYLLSAPLWHVISLTLLVLAAYGLAPTAGFTRALPPELAGRQVVEVTFSFYSRVDMVLGFLLWLWWCDRPPRTTKAMAWGLAGWLAWLSIRASVIGAVLRLCYVERGAWTTQDFSHALLSGHLPGTNWDWFILFDPARFALFNGASSLHFTSLYAPHALLACALYALAKWAARKHGGDWPKYI